MDELERAVEAYRVRAGCSVACKLDVLMDLECIDDPRVVPFMMQVLADAHESDEVRLHVLRQLRSVTGRISLAERLRAARAIGDVLSDRNAADLRLQAALALGEFILVEGVPAMLGAVSLAQHESIDLRYAAFTSLERAGPTIECIGLLRQMSSDDTLGRVARSVLSEWHADSSTLEGDCA